MDPTTVRQDLTTWQCEGKRCGPCLSALTVDATMFEFAVETITTMRETTFSRAEHEMRPYIRTLLTTLLRKSKSTLQYVVAGVECCKAAWNWAHGFSAATSNRVHAEFNRWWTQANPIDKPSLDSLPTVSGVTHTCDLWILRWIMLATHHPPNATKPSIPDIGASVLHPQYVAWCLAANETPTTIDGFRGRLSVIKRYTGVRSRASKQASAECDICSMLKRAKARAISLQHKGAIEKLRAEHLAFTNAEVAVYDQHIFEAKDALASDPEEPQVYRLMS